MTNDSLNRIGSLRKILILVDDQENCIFYLAIGNGSFMVQYYPDLVGLYNMSIKYEGFEVSGGPFQINVYPGKNLNL